MADQADVETALAALVANALYPNGTGAASVTGAVYRVYRGYPASPVLDADLAAGVVHVSVAPAGGEVRNVTRYPRVWREVAPVLQLLTAVVNGVSVTFSGNCAVGQLAGVMVNEAAFPYAVQANDSPATVASNLAALIRTAGWIVDYAGSTLAVPGADKFVARVVAGAGALQEIRRQVQEFRVSMWCPDPGTRDAAAPVIDVALADAGFIPLADGSYCRARFTGVTTSDGGADADLYRRDLTYAVEYPTTLSQLTPAMLFGTVTASANDVTISNFLS
jgi:uncharacterized protein YaiE (UPF0345 family)